MNYVVVALISVFAAISVQAQPHLPNPSYFIENRDFSVSPNGLSMSQNKETYSFSTTPTLDASTSNKKGEYAVNVSKKDGAITSITEMRAPPFSKDLIPFDFS